VKCEVLTLMSNAHLRVTSEQTVWPRAHDCVNYTRLYFTALDTTPRYETPTGKQPRLWSITLKWIPIAVKLHHHVIGSGFSFIN